MNKIAKFTTKQLTQIRGKLYRDFVSLSLFSATSIAILGLTIFSIPAKAQASCEPPQSDEYLLLIVTKTPEQQEKAKSSFPGNTDNTVCRYINDTVTRVGGFRNSEIANDWVKYIKDVVGLQAYVVRSPAAALPQNLPVYDPQPAPGSEPIAVKPSTPSWRIDQ